VSSEEILEPLAACVHCGFCLPACPTYLATGDESDSPRGRIHLMRALAHGSLTADDAALGEHLDACLGCRGCEPVCPSGVRYGEGLEAARAELVRARGLPFMSRAVLAVFRRRWLWRPILALARLFRATRIPDLLAGRGRIGFPMAMLAATRPSVPPCPPPSPRRKPGPPSPSQLFSGCVMSGLFPHVHRATGAALADAGMQLERPRGQVCCGALHAHAGDLAGARALAKANIAAFRNTEGPIVLNSAGCGAMLKQYGHLLGTEEAERLSARVRDVSEVLTRDARPVTRDSRLVSRVPRPALSAAYDSPCHLQHAQGIVREPLALLAEVPGLSLIPLPDADKCCGSAGIFSLTEPGMSRAVLAAKIAAIRSLDPAPDLVLTGNPGCLMQIGAGLLAAGSPIRTAHPVELLAAGRH
jgi:glycolate oxidase iron-sulfur subunit